MSEQLQLRRNSATNLATFTGAIGEVVVDTTNNRLVLQDGLTAGGFAAAKLSETQTISRSQSNNANYTMQASDRVIAFIAITAARTVALVAASAFPQGATLFVFDQSGACSASHTITLNAAGSDAIDGGSSAVISVAYGFVALQSNGTNKWTIVAGGGTPATPNMDGSASLGVSALAARADHVHPSDTSLAALAGATFTGALVAAAGTASLAPFSLQSGTNLTTAAAGAFEYDGNVFYATVKGSERGVLMAEQLAAQNQTTYTLISQTAAQPLFNVTSAGALTLATGFYVFECLLYLTGMSATSGTFGFALGGTATFASVGWGSLASMGTLATPQSPQTTFNTSAANAALTSGSTATTGFALIKGTVRVNGAGTLIPQVSLSTAAAASVGPRSYFRIAPLGAPGVTNVGNWS